MHTARGFTPADPLGDNQCHEEKASQSKQELPNGGLTIAGKV